MYALLHVLLCSTYGFSAHRAGKLKLVHSDIAVLRQQFLFLLLVGLLDKLNIDHPLITWVAANLHICNVSTKAMLVKEVKTFRFCDLV